jgi:hypothetical protein
LIKTFGSNPIDLGRLEERLRNWLSYYITENALLPRKNARSFPRDDKGKLTPYNNNNNHQKNEFKYP